MQVKIKRLHPEAKMPTYATDGSAAFDLYAATAYDYKGEDKAYCKDRFTTGLAFEIPKDHVMLVFSRSGHGFKDRASLINCVGVIDSDYRGEVAVKMNKPIPCGAGDRIAQALILPVEQVKFEWSETLSNTARGVNGFGSTGVK